MEEENNKRVEDLEVEFSFDSLDSLKSFPEEVKDVIGHQLRLVQRRAKTNKVKKLTYKITGKIYEIRVSFDTDAYRLVYTGPIGTIIYVIYAFQKKSKKGSKTPKKDSDAILSRYKSLQQDLKNRGET